MPLTMKDIAGMLGVAESTVSRAINGKPGVSESLKTEILALVQKHQFTPNALAKGLASNQTRILGLILPDIANSHLNQIVQGIEARASELGYQLILANTGGNQAKELKYLTFFQQNRVEGIIFVGGALAEGEILKLGLNRYPLVLVNKLIEELELPTLLLDHELGAELAVQHLVEQGHREIGLLVGELDDLANVQIWQGYQSGLAKAGLPFRESLVVEVENSRSGGYEGYLRLLEEDAAPTAVFAAGDLLALGAVEALKFGGYLIPEDVAVIGYGDTQITGIIDPPLTTVGLPHQELGQRAVQQLIKVIQKQELEEPIVVLSPEIIRRRST